MACLAAAGIVIGAAAPCVRQLRRDLIENGLQLVKVDWLERDENRIPPLSSGEYLLLCRSQVERLP